jgi:micrococcal nuclease
MRSKRILEQEVRLIHRLIPKTCALHASLIFSLFLLSILFYACEGIAAEVVGVIDGDTIEVLHNGQAERIRLNAIDCPEKGQPFGKKAKQFTSSLVFDKEVTIKPYKRDRHGRTVADIFLADQTNVSYEIVRAGLAWWYRKYSKNPNLAELETHALKDTKGLWADANPIPPWDFRHPRKKEIQSSPMLGAMFSAFSSPAHDKDSAPIIGNSKSHIYQRPDCPNYTATAPKNRIMFNSPADAENAAYRLARTCPHQ